MIFFEKFEGRLPVEQQPPDRWMFRQQGVEIVRLFVGNGAVKASRPLAGADCVPKRNMVAHEHVVALVKVARKGLMTDRRHQRPEPVSRVPVVAAERKRPDAWHAAQDQHARRRTDNRRKAMKKLCAELRCGCI